MSEILRVNEKRTFTRDVTIRDYYGVQRDTIRLTRLGRLTACVSLAVAGYFGFSNKYMDIEGDAPKKLPVAPAQVVAQNRYNQTFQAAPPAGKFALQYLTSTDVAERGNTDGNSFAGEAGSSREDYQFHFNNGCLANTAYDIDGGKTEGTITGLFTRGEVHGDVPTAAANAYTDSDNPDELVVESGHAGSKVLRFTGVENGTELQPADQQTEDVLETYGCKTGLTSYSKVGQDGYGSNSSPWVSQ